MHSLVVCRALTDGRLSVAGSVQSPAAILIEHTPSATPRTRLRVLAIGRLEHVRAHPAASAARTVDAGDSVVLPGLINAHTHLDLTVIGPRPHDPAEGFSSWVQQIRTHRKTDADDIRESVEAGVRLSRAGGVAAVGDIAGAVNGAASLVAADALRDSGLPGVSFIEFFAIGPTAHERWSRAADLVRSQPSRHQGDHRIGLQPHAPNTVAPAAYRAAASLAGERGLPLMTHLAESPEEHEFIADAVGPQRTLLESLGLWDDETAADFGRGRSPVEHLAEILDATNAIAVHVNQCSDSDLELLARSKITVVYCPRASAYFGVEQQFGPHRYRDMIAAGIRVAVGTDSIVNLPAGTDRLSPIDEIRYLHDRDQAEPDTLIQMATINGAAAVGFGEAAACLAPESRPMALASVRVADAEIDKPSASVLASRAVPKILFE